MKKVLSLLVGAVLVTAIACNSTSEPKVNTDSIKAANAADSVKKAAEMAAPKMDTAAAKADTAAKKMDKMDKKK